MPKEEEESKGADKPPLDPIRLLGQLKGIVQGSKKPSGGGKSMVGTLVILAVVLLGVAVWSWISWRRGRELAKLRHAKNKAKILAEQAEAVKHLAADKKEIAILERAVDEAADRLRVIEADIRAEEARHEADLRAIDSIRSWRDAGVR